MVTEEPGVVIFLNAFFGEQEPCAGTWVTGMIHTPADSINPSVLRRCIPSSRSAPGDLEQLADCPMSQIPEGLQVIVISIPISQPEFFPSKSA